MTLYFLRIVVTKSDVFRFFSIFLAFLVHLSLSLLLLVYSLSLSCCLHLSQFNCIPSTMHNVPSEINHSPPGHTVFNLLKQIGSASHTLGLRRRRGDREALWSSDYVDSLAASLSLSIVLSLSFSLLALYYCLFLHLSACITVSQQTEFRVPITNKLLTT